MDGSFQNFKHSQPASVASKTSDWSHFKGGKFPHQWISIHLLNDLRIQSWELKLNLFNGLVQVVRKMWTILSVRIPKWLILAETNLWEYFEHVEMGGEGGGGGRWGLKNKREIENNYWSNVFNNKFVTLVRFTHPLKSEVWSVLLTWFLSFTLSHLHTFLLSHLKIALNSQVFNTATSIVWILCCFVCATSLIVCVEANDEGDAQGCYVASNHLRI